MQLSDDAAASTRKKHRPTLTATPPADRGAGGGQDFARGRLPAGREVEGPLPTARRRSEEALARLGKETALDTAARLEAEGNPTAARQLREWAREDLFRVASLVACLPSPDGSNRSERRELRVALCGVAFLARRGDVVDFARRGCKDRICPTCGHRRRLRFTAALRRIAGERQFAPAAAHVGCDDTVAGELAGEGLVTVAGELAGGGLVTGELSGPFVERRRLLFVTLTQPKYAREVFGEDGSRTLEALPACRAVDRLLGSPETDPVTGKPCNRGGAWRRFRHHSRPWLLGGVRSLEVTARRIGDWVGRHRVTVPGAHAHLHCLLEVRGGTTADDVRAAWQAACPGAVEQAIDVQELDDDNVYQVGSYVFDTRKLLDTVKIDPDYVRDVLAALHGRRLVAAFGTWKIYDLGLREPKGDVVYGDRAVYTLTENRPEDQPPIVRWADGTEEPLESVLPRFLASRGRPLGGIEPHPTASAEFVPESDEPLERLPASLARPRGPP